MKIEVTNIWSSTYQPWSATNSPWFTIGFQGNSSFSNPTSSVVHGWTVFASTITSTINTTATIATYGRTIVVSAVNAVFSFVALNTNPVTWTRIAKRALVWQKQSIPLWDINIQPWLSTYQPWITGIRRVTYTKIAKDTTSWNNITKYE